MYIFHNIYCIMYMLMYFMHILYVYNLFSSMKIIYKQIDIREACSTFFTDDIQIIKFEFRVSAAPKGPI